MGFSYRKSVNLGHGNLSYTVVRGEVLGNWEAHRGNE
jgi:hypothetical protein